MKKHIVSDIPIIAHKKGRDNPCRKNLRKSFYSENTVLASFDFRYKKTTTLLGGSLYVLASSFRVRDGNGWTPCVINTNCVLSENSCYYSTTFSKMQVFFYNFLINLKFSYYFIVLFDYPR